MSGGRRRWGFHRLTDEAARRFVAEAGVARGDLVVDIGAGDGTISAALLDHGVRVVAVELHPARVRLLRQRFGETVTVVPADIAELRLPARPFRVVSNPPFTLATATVKRLVAPRSRLERADLILPAWSARQWAHERRGSWRQVFATDLGPTLPSGAFRPSPPRDVRVLRIHRRGRGPRRR